MRIVTSPWRVEFNAFFGTLQNTLRVAAPFYSSEPVVELLRRCKGRKKYFLLALEEQSVKGNFQSVSAIRAILEDRESEVRFIRNLHAKFVVADERAAIVTSANLTSGGLDKNIEMGVRFNDPKVVKHVVHQFDALWAKAATITAKELEYYSALPRGKNKRSNRGKAHGPKVRLGKLPERPPDPGTPALGWIVVHSEDAYKREGVWESPMRQLKELWDPSEGVLDWGWTSPTMKENPTPRRVLLAWKGEVFGHAIATIRSASEEEKREGSQFFFVLTKFRRAKRVPFEKLPLGQRRRHHRGLIRLDEKMLAAYWTRLR